MTWNGRVNVHDDLSRLHSSLRAADTSREIGYSSVTQGEGSLDLLTESGAVRAQIGDQPDGRFGVSIWHKWTLRFIPDLIEDLEAEDGSLSDRISDLGDRMISVGNRMLAAEGRLDSHNTRIHDNDGRISGLGDRMLDVEGQGRAHNTRINTAQARADSAWTRAGTALANAATAQARADNAHTRIDGLNYASPGDIATLSNQVQALRSQVHDWMQTARASNPSLPPPIPN